MFTVYKCHREILVNHRRAEKIRTVHVKSRFTALLDKCRDGTFIFLADAKKSEILPTKGIIHFVPDFQ